MLWLGLTLWGASPCPHPRPGLQWSLRSLFLLSTTAFPTAGSAEQQVLFLCCLPGPSGGMGCAPTCSWVATGAHILPVIDHSHTIIQSWMIQRSSTSFSYPYVNFPGCCQHKTNADFHRRVKIMEEEAQSTENWNLNNRWHGSKVPWPPCRCEFPLAAFLGKALPLFLALDTPFLSL